MEQLLTDAQLQSELSSFKTTADLLASQKLRYPHGYVPPAEERPRKPTLVNVPVVDPPSTAADDDEAGPSNETISLTVKSLKPPLSFTLSARPTSTIADLKAQLAKSESAAPPPEAQRWILKGKAMGDSKLLKEFPVEAGSTINLMVTKVASPSPSPAPPAASSSSTSDDPSDAHAVPALTLSEPAAPGTSPSEPPQLSLATDLSNLPLSTSADSSTNFDPALAGLSDQFLSGVQDPEWWTEVRALCEKKFGEGSKDAQTVWEGFFGGARDWVTPNQKALIRERVRFSAMGGV
ncbi:hypothetical protein JCM8547_003144 [Rhodosporidiobolus lusitaniae]